MPARCCAATRAFDRSLHTTHSLSGDILGIIQDIENSCSHPNQNSDIFWTSLSYHDIEALNPPGKSCGTKATAPCTASSANGMAKIICASRHEEDRKTCLTGRHGHVSNACSSWPNLGWAPLGLTVWLHLPAVSMVSICFDYWISMDLSQGVQDVQDPGKGVCGYKCQQEILNFG